MKWEQVISNGYYIGSRLRGILAFCSGGTGNTTLLFNILGHFIIQIDNRLYFQ